MIAILAALLTLLPLQPRDGVASWYGPLFDGHLTASGATYDMHQLTAAHRTLPLGTVLIVQTPKRKPVQVRVTDRGPYIAGRSLDLSPVAFSTQAATGAGLVRVWYRVVGRDVTGLRYNLTGGCYGQ